MLSIHYTLLAVLVLLHVVNAANPDLDETWSTYKEKHGKDYDEEKDGQRREVWEGNLLAIMLHNVNYLLGLTTYKIYNNKYADIDHDKFVRTMNGFKPGNTTLLGRTFSKGGLLGAARPPTFKPPVNVTLPKAFDWRDKGAVTPVKDQGSCGSCWTFSSTGAVEGAAKVKTGKLINLSEQNLIDCAQSEGNSGCDGGLMDYAFSYIKKNGGIVSDQSYPYTGKDGKCEFKKKNVAATVKGFVDIPPGDEKALQKALVTVGPISVAIDASQPSFQFYSEGIYDDPNCSSDGVDHGVLLVGYGTEKGGDYWLVKNSWGTDWGIDGYIKMARNKNNHCGIATTASYPVV